MFEGERDRESESVRGRWREGKCDREKPTERKRDSVCVCERERESKRVGNVEWKTKIV